MMRLVSQVMVAPLLVGGPRRYLITAAYGVAAVLAGGLWLIVPLALWRSIGMGWSLLWLIPTTTAVFALTVARDEPEESCQTVTTWPEVEDEEPDEHEMPSDLPEGYQDWLAEIMQPPPKWYRIGQYVTIALFTLIFAVAVIEQWFLWMVVMVELIDPWAIVFGVTIAAFQMLCLLREQPKKSLI